MPKTVISSTEGAAQDIEDPLEQSLVEVVLLLTKTYYDSLKRYLKLLGDNPEMGRTAEEIRPEYRRLPTKTTCFPANRPAQTTPSSFASYTSMWMVMKV
ncbi:MAG: type II toxin-antitoxin system RelE/ParE family toxin [Desulfurivibrionaceae bacterium]